jgi:hypothetical protein
LAKEALEAEAFRAKLGSENGERYALQFRQAMQDLRRDFVPTPASAPGPNSLVSDVYCKLHHVTLPRLFNHGQLEYAPSGVPCNNSVSPGPTDHSGSLAGRRPRCEQPPPIAARQDYVSSETHFRAYTLFVQVCGPTVRIPAVPCVSPNQIFDTFSSDASHRSRQSLAAPAHHDVKHCDN